MSALSTYALEALLPHRPPMLLLDRILLAEPEQLWSMVALTTSSPFVESEGVPTNVALEYLAQSAAAFFGIRSAQQSGAKTRPTAQPGMLIACSRLSCADAYFAVPGALLIQVQQTSAMPGNGGGLVRFRGAAACLSAAVANTTTLCEREQLDALWPSEPPVSADFSVYLQGRQQPEPAQ